MINLNTFFYIFILLVNNALFFTDNSGDQMWLYGFSMFVTLVYTVSTIYSKYRNGVVYRYFTNPAYFALLGFFIVNFQTITNCVLGLAPISYYLNSYDYSSYIGKVTYAGNIGICSFVWAHSHYIPKLKEVPKKQINLGCIWSLLTLVTFIGFLSNINVAFFLSGEDYVGSGGYDRIAKSYAVYEMLFDVFNTITLASFINSYSGNTKIKWTFLSFIRKLPLFYIVINVFYLFLRAFSGDRGPVIYTLLMFFFTYFYLSKKKFKLVYIVSMIFIAAFVVSVANVVRSEDHEASLSERIALGVEDKDGKIVRNSISPYTQELASSVNCNFIAIHDIEEEKTSYKLGEYSILHLLDAIPGISSVYQRLVGKKYAGGSGEYLTQSFFGKYYLFGLGTTPIAELYLDFGILGIIIGFMIMGVIYKLLDFKLLFENQSSIVSLILLLKFSSMSIYLPRSSITFIATKALYAVIIYLIIIYVSKLFYSSKG